MLADHPVHTEHSGGARPIPTEWWIGAAEALADWEGNVVLMDWPGDDAVDAERWNPPPPRATSPPWARPWPGRADALPADGAERLSLAFRLGTGDECLFNRRVRAPRWGTSP